MYVILIIGENMKNNKGFAISLMLYAMILLIVTIFYIVLAIVKTRFIYSETMVNSAIEFLDKHDDSMNHKDRTGPLVVFDPPASGASQPMNITIEIYDDNDGGGLNTDSILIAGNFGSGDGPNLSGATYYENGIKRNPNITAEINSDKTHAHFVIPISISGTIYVSVKDTEGNFSQTLPRYTGLKGSSYVTYSYQRYIITSTGPSCELQDPKLVSYTSSGTPGTSNYKINIGGYTPIANKKINSGDMIVYELVCRGENGIDAYLNVNDFKHTAKTKEEDNKQNKYIYVNSISVVNGINETRVIILATGFYIPNGTGDAECTEPLAIELKDSFNIKDSAGNMAVIGNNQRLDFNDHKVQVCMAGNGTDPGTNPGTDPGTNPGGDSGSDNPPPGSYYASDSSISDCNYYFYNITFECSDFTNEDSSMHNQDHNHTVEGYTSESTAKAACDNYYDNFKCPDGYSKSSKNCTISKNFGWSNGVNSHEYYSTATDAMDYCHKYNSRKNITAGCHLYCAN